MAGDRGQGNRLAGPADRAADVTVMDVATLMLREGVRHLVVARGGRAVGVVSRRDTLAALVKAVTPDTVFVMLERMEIDAPELWLG
ncbi:MAG TPA: CBS domain-containing protein [Acidimicrobiales bacterium]|nr:CBS domain-containing protein [Acidimicrobiales bacterium]